MNKQLIQIIDKHLRQITTITLTLLAAGFALLGLLAQTPTSSPSPRKAECKDWPPCKPGQDCDKVHDDVKRVFEGLLDEASTGTKHGKKLRGDLLNPANCFEKAHTEVKNRLRKISIPFGKEHHVMFYEPETPVDETGGGISDITVYPNNHCMHIFFLPEEVQEGESAARKADFGVHLKCCYQPWAPQKQKQEK